MLNMNQYRMIFFFYRKAAKINLFDFYCLKTQQQMETLRNQLNEMSANQQAYVQLKSSTSEIEKRCVKHQKSEIATKRQLNVFKDHIVSYFIYFCNSLIHI